MGDYPDDCDHTSLEIVEVTKDGRFHVEGSMKCLDCDSIFLFRGGPE